MATMKRDIPLKGRFVSDPAASEHENGPASRFRFVEEDFKRADDGGLARDDKGFPIVENKIFHDAVIWYPQLGDRVNDTFTSGDAFLATGDLRFSTFEDKDGNTRTGHEFVIKQIGADVASGKVAITRDPKVAAGPAKTAAPEPVIEPAPAPAM